MHVAETRHGADDYRALTEEVLKSHTPSGPWYIAGLIVTGLLALAGAAVWAVQLGLGLTVTGKTHPVMWSSYITDFVWWIGLAHAGILLSTLLFLLRAPFRTMLSRVAEAMAVLALLVAALFPIIHLGRAWRFYWLVPYPNQRDLWVNFNSLLILDLFAVAADLLVSTLYFWLGLLPDLAILRDRSSGWRRTFYGLFSLGWEGTARQWRPYLVTYSLLAAMLPVLAVLVHSIVAWDFSTTILPGWHSTLFPPYFLAAAVLSGLAMLLLLLIPVRSYLRLKEYITLDRLDDIAKLVLFASLLITYCYLIEYVVTFREGEPLRVIDRLNRALGLTSLAQWGTVICTLILPLAFFWRRVRRTIPALVGLSLFIVIGLWLERFTIIAGGLMRDYLPYAWEQEPYRFSLAEIGITFGALGAFLFGFLLFARYLPVLPIAEMKREILRERREEAARDISARPAGAAPRALRLPASRQGGGLALPASAADVPAGSRGGGTLGEFERATRLRAAIDRAKQYAFHDMTAYLPVADAPTIDRAAPGARVVPLLALAGAAAGFGFGLWLTIATSHDYPQVVGGKPLIALPPFLIVASELMFIGAGWGAIAGFLILARLPDLCPSAAYHPDLAVDRFGLYLPCDTPAERELAAELLRAAGAVTLRSVSHRERAPLDDAA
jgi:Ni/Fe-hydrogenase subunit HybB-like protein